MEFHELVRMNINEFEHIRDTIRDVFGIENHKRNLTNKNGTIRFYECARINSNI